MLSRSESLFYFTINTKRLLLYANCEKNVKFHHTSFVNERKKLSFALYSIPGFHKNKKPSRNVASKLVQILRNLVETQKFSFL